MITQMVGYAHLLSKGKLHRRTRTFANFGDTSDLTSGSLIEAFVINVTNPHFAHGTFRKFAEENEILFRNHLQIGWEVECFKKMMQSQNNDIHTCHVGQECHTLRSTKSRGSSIILDGAEICGSCYGGHRERIYGRDRWERICSNFLPTIDFP